MNKLTIVVLNLVLATALIPMVWMFSENAKQDTTSVSFNITTEGGTLTTEQLTTIIDNFDLIDTGNNLNFASTVPLEIKKTETYTTYDVSAQLPNEQLINLQAGDVIQFIWDESLYTATSNEVRLQNFYTIISQTDLWGVSSGNGPSFTNNVIKLYYNETFLSLVTWDDVGLEFVFNATPYSDIWIEWIPDPVTETGIINILQNWPTPIGYGYGKSSSPVVSPNNVYDFSTALTDPTVHFTLYQGSSALSFVDNTSSDPVIKTTSTVETWDFDPADLVTNTYYIRAGDYITHNKSTIRNNVSYTEYLTFNSGSPVRPYFSITGTGFSFNYNVDQLLTYEGGVWNNPTLATNFSDSWIDWSVTGDVGTLTFLQDLPNPIHSVRISTNFTLSRYYWQNSTNMNTNSTLYMTIPPSELELNYGNASLFINAETGVITIDGLLVGDQTVIIDIVVAQTGVLGSLITLLPFLFVIGIISFVGYAIKKKF